MNTLYRSFHKQVLVVAVLDNAYWSAYIFPVPGVNHEAESRLWKTIGQKLPEDIARSIFTIFTDVPYHQ